MELRPRFCMLPMGRALPLSLMLSLAEIRWTFRWSTGERVAAVRMPVLGSRPGIFTVDGSGRGQGAILNEDGTLNSPSNPARKG